MKCVRLLLALVAALLAAPLSHADPRPISDTERAAVEIAARYQAEGAQAIIASLSSTSPLRAIEAPLLPSEIEARLGPHAKSTWDLVTVVEALANKTVAFDVSYPSGIEDTVFFDVVQENGAYRLRDVRNLAMASTRGEYYPAAVVASSEEKPKHDNAVPLTALAAAIVAIAGVCVAPFHRLTARLLLIVAFLGGAGAVALSKLREARDADAPAATKVVQTGPRLARLVALRAAIANGGEGVDAIAAETPKIGATGDIARLWIAQWNFQQGKLAEVESALKQFPVPSTIPLVELLRARLALSRNDQAGALVAYQRAINLGPGRDSLWLETSSAHFAAGFEDDAKKTFARVAKIGSRDVNLYYTQAMMEADPAKSEEILKRAWSMQPAERRHLLASGVLWSIVRKRGPMLVNLSDPREATFASASVSTRPITVAPTAMTSVSGELLHIDSDGAELYVPGGAALAPVGTPTVDAGTWSRNEEEAALRAVPALLAKVPSAASYMQPALRERITASASALAKRNRWTELVQLTESVTPKSEFIPSAVFLLRATALEHVARRDDAKKLLLDVAASPALARKRDVSGLEQVGDMLASHDQFPAALKMYERASALGAAEYADIRIDQIAMDQRLAQQFSRHNSPHFEIHYPSDVSALAAAQFANVLEAELKRLQRWVPVSDFKPVVVNIVWWKDFKGTYTQSENILGFYNGKITLPLAGIYEMDPMIVSLMTHELCHAMIAQATNNNAPRWFHEGLAQRVEMVPYAPNAFNMYEDEKLLAVSVLDPVLGGSRDPDMMGAAYVVAQTFLRYIESSVGEAGIRALVAQFAAGASAEEAIANVSKRSLADFDVAFRAWGKAENRVFANPMIVRYDEVKTQ